MKSDHPIIAEILSELDRATTKFPMWPDDPLHAVAVINEEVGELNRALVQAMYEPGKLTPDDVRKEAVQSAAMLLRFIASLDRYAYGPGQQHAQVGSPFVMPDMSRAQVSCALDSYSMKYRYAVRGIPGQDDIRFSSDERLSASDLAITVRKELERRHEQSQRAEDGQAQAEEN
jgi:hypothetical protein